MEHILPQETAAPFKPLNELNLIDDFLFTAIAAKADVNKKFFRILLRTVLGKDIEIEDVIPQNIFPAVDTDRHGIRIDAYIKASPTAAAQKPVLLRHHRRSFPAERRLLRGTAGSGDHYHSFL